jgi:cytochrome P450
MFAAGTETTATALTWLWVALESRADVADRLCAEVERVVGSGPVMRDHLKDLKYTKTVLQELVRLYPVGWLIPRTAMRRDVIDGYTIRAGGTVLISPFLTQRLPEFWPNPDYFDPDRFSRPSPHQQHRFAYFPFGGGPHQCLGNHLFTVEAQVIIATMLSRYRPRLMAAGPIDPLPAASLRPARAVRLLLKPVAKADGSLRHAA